MKEAAAEAEDHNQEEAAVAHHSSQPVVISNPQRLATNSQLLHPRLPPCAAHATRDHLGQLVQREHPDPMVRMGTTERTDRMARMPKRCRHRMRSQTLSARLDQMDHKALLDRKDRPDQRDRLASLHVTEFPVNRECKASPDQSAVPVVMDHAVHPANPVVLSPCPAHKDQLDRLDQPESKDQRDSLAQTDNPLKDHPVRLVMPASLDVKDAPVAPDPLDYLAKMARRAAATIVQSHVHRPATFPRPEAIVAAVELETTSTDECHHVLLLLCAHAIALACTATTATKQREKGIIARNELNNRHNQQ